MSEINLESLDIRDFGKIVPTRMAVIEAAPDTPLPSADPIAELAKALHPQTQYLLVESIVERGEDAKSFTLIPNEACGTSSLAYFNAGQYLSVSLNIDGIVVAKPYSLCSAPADALLGRYVITVKRTDYGFASEYILDNWKVGDTVEVSGPQGTFTYEPLRDAAQVIGLAGGSGITPFYSLAAAIADGTEDFALTLLYGSRTSDGTLLKEEFDALEAACPKIKVIHVLSDEEAEGFETGFITADLIRKYTSDGDFSIFICGPQVMYNFVDREIEKLGLPVRRVRHELFGEYKNPEKNSDYPQEAGGKEYALKVCIREEIHEITCSAIETLLVAMERAKIQAPARCRSGECGFCHSWLVSGDVYVPTPVDGRRLADLKFNYIHPCCTFPLSDIEIVVPSM